MDGDADDIAQTFFETCTMYLQANDAVNKDQCASPSALDRQSLRLCSTLGQYLSGDSYHRVIASGSTPDCLVPSGSTDHGAALACDSAGLPTDVCALLTHLQGCAAPTSRAPVVTGSMQGVTKAVLNELMPPSSCAWRDNACALTAGATTVTGTACSSRDARTCTSDTGVGGICQACFRGDDKGGAACTPQQRTWCDTIMDKAGQKHAFYLSFQNDDDDNPQWKHTTQCSNLEYESVAPTLTSDRTCTLMTTCDLTQVESSPERLTPVVNPFCGMMTDDNGSCLKQVNGNTCIWSSQVGCQGADTTDTSCSSIATQQACVTNALFGCTTEMAGEKTTCIGAQDQFQAGPFGEDRTCRDASDSSINPVCNKWQLDATWTAQEVAPCEVTLRRFDDPLLCDEVAYVSTDSDVPPHCVGTFRSRALRIGEGKYPAHLIQDMLHDSDGQFDALSVSGMDGCSVHGLDMGRGMLPGSRTTQLGYLGPAYMPTRDTALQECQKAGFDKLCEVEDVTQAHLCEPGWVSNGIAETWNRTGCPAPVDATQWTTQQSLEDVYEGMYQHCVNAQADGASAQVLGECCGYDESLRDKCTLMVRHGNDVFCTQDPDEKGYRHDVDCHVLDQTACSHHTPTCTWNSHGDTQDGGACAYNPNLGWDATKQIFQNAVCSGSKCQCHACDDPKCMLPLACPSTMTCTKQFDGIRLDVNTGTWNGGNCPGPLGWQSGTPVSYRAVNNAVCTPLASAETPVPDIASSDMCEQVCSRNVKCVGVHYDASERTCQMMGVCDLTGTETSKAHALKMTISAPQPDVFLGDDTPYFQWTSDGHAMTRARCQDACLAEPTCTGFAYHASTGSCQLAQPQLWTGAGAGDKSVDGECNTGTTFTNEAANENVDFPGCPSTDWCCRRSTASDAPRPTPQTTLRGSTWEYAAVHTRAVGAQPAGAYCCSEGTVQLPESAFSVSRERLADAHAIVLLDTTSLTREMEDDVQQQLTCWGLDEDACQDAEHADACRWSMSPRNPCPLSHPFALPDPACAVHKTENACLQDDGEDQQCPLTHPFLRRSGSSTKVACFSSDGSACRPARLHDSVVDTDLPLCAPTPQRCSWDGEACVGKLACYENANSTGTHCLKSSQGKHNWARPGMRGSAPPSVCPPQYPSLRPVCVSSPDQGGVPPLAYLHDPTLLWPASRRTDARQAAPLGWFETSDQRLQYCVATTPPECVTMQTPLAAPEPCHAASASACPFSNPHAYVGGRDGKSYCCATPLVAGTDIDTANTTLQGLTANSDAAKQLQAQIDAVQDGQILDHCAAPASPLPCDGGSSNTCQDYCTPGTPLTMADVLARSCDAYEWSCTVGGTTPCAYEGSQGTIFGCRNRDPASPSPTCGEHDSKTSCNNDAACVWDDRLYLRGLPWQSGDSNDAMMPPPSCPTATTAFVTLPEQKIRCVAPVAPVTSVKSEAQCQQKCMDTFACTGYNLTATPPPNDDDASVAAAAPSTTDMTLQRHAGKCGVGTVVPDVASRDACMEHCSASHQCVAMQWHAVTKRCELLQLDSGRLPLSPDGAHGWQCATKNEEGDHGPLQCELVGCSSPTVPDPDTTSGFLPVECTPRVPCSKEYPYLADERSCSKVPPTLDECVYQPATTDATQLVSTWQLFQPRPPHASSATPASCDATRSAISCHCPVDKPYIVTTPGQPSQCCADSSYAVESDAAPPPEANCEPVQEDPSQLYPDACTAVPPQSMHLYFDDHDEVCPQCSDGFMHQACRWDDAKKTCQGDAGCPKHITPASCEPCYPLTSTLHPSFAAARQACLHNEACEGVVAFGEGYVLAGTEGSCPASPALDKVSVDSACTTQPRHLTTPQCNQLCQAGTLALPTKYNALPGYTLMSCTDPPGDMADSKLKADCDSDPTCKGFVHDLVLPTLCQTWNDAQWCGDTCPGSSADSTCTPGHAYKNREGLFVCGEDGQLAPATTGKDTTTPATTDEVMSTCLAAFATFPSVGRVHATSPHLIDYMQKTKECSSYGSATCPAPACTTQTQPNSAILTADHDICPGDNLASFPSNDVEACNEACYSNRACTSYVLYKGMCNLKSCTGPLVSQSGASVGQFLTRSESTVNNCVAVTRPTTQNNTTGVASMLDAHDAGLGIGGCGGAPYLPGSGTKTTYPQCLKKCADNDKCIKVQWKEDASPPNGSCFLIDNTTQPQAYEPNGNEGWRCAFKQFENPEKAAQAGVDFTLLPAYHPQLCKSATRVAKADAVAYPKDSSALQLMPMCATTYTPGADSSCVRDGTCTPTSPTTLSSFHASTKRLAQDMCSSFGSSCAGVLKMDAEKFQLSGNDMCGPTAT